MYLYCHAADLYFCKPNEKYDSLWPYWQHRHLRVIVTVYVCFAFQPKGFISLSPLISNSILYAPDHIYQNMAGNTLCNTLFASLFKCTTETHCFEFLKRRLPQSTIKRLDGLFQRKCKTLCRIVDSGFLKNASQMEYLLTVISQPSWLIKFAQQ